MKKELLNQELEMVNGGYSLKDEVVDKICDEVETMTKLTRLKKSVDKEKNNPVHAYDMIEYNKR